MSSAIDTREDRFSNTPGDCKLTTEFCLLQENDYREYGKHQPDQNHYPRQVVINSHAASLSDPIPAIAVRNRFGASYLTHHSINERIPLTLLCHDILVSEFIDYFNCVDSDIRILV